MPRRKRDLLDDLDSDSSVGSDVEDIPDLPDNDPDLREERELFENPYGRKKRRKGGKEDAIYGVFADDSEEEEKYTPKKRETRGRRSDWTKAPAFTKGNQNESSKPSDDDQVMEDADNAEDSDAGSVGSGDSGDAHMSDAASPGLRAEEPEEEREDREAEEEEERQPKGGLGMGASKGASASMFTGFSRGGIGSARLQSTQDDAEQEPVPKGGIGLGGGARTSNNAFPAFGKGGIGSSRSTPATSQSPPPSLPSGLPSAFGASRTQRSFLRDGSTGSDGTRTPPPLAPHERAHFSKLQGTFGARMLEKMGWQAGTGLGVTGEGIVTPVESKLRPGKMGIAYKGFKEKTEQSKAEARRRGEVVSDDEDEGKAKKGRRAGRTVEDKSEAWKKPRKTKRKVQHKTYEEILAEAGDEAPAPGIGPIIDATGATPREVSSLAEVSMASWTPSTDPTRIPEVRHNLRLIADACKVDLDGLAREARALEERKKWVGNEDARLRKKVSEEAGLIERLQQVHLVADDINAQAKGLASTYEASMDAFSPLFEKLLSQFSPEFDKYHLDEIVVAAIAPIFRRMLAQWRPLEDPAAFTSIFRAWRGALKVAPEEKPRNQLDLYGSGRALTSPATQVDKPMTPFESLLWNVWLPKVRSVINNDWDPRQPQQAVKLYEAWSIFLPPFIRDNFFDQLILPKVRKAVADWNPRKDTVPLQTLVFLWLPHIGLRIEEVLGDAKRKLKSSLRSWSPRDGVPEDLLVWKNVFGADEWDNMMLKYIVPKLGALLRDEFKIDPRNQNMEPINQVLAWADIIRSSVFSQILETEFFPKWLEILHFWLIQPSASFEEVAQWYSFWKGVFPEYVQSMPDVRDEFTRGLQLMNTAIELGPEARNRLPRPERRKPDRASKATSRQGTPKPRAPRTQEITFRSIVEEYAASHNLLFIPTGRAHETSRMPLFRVSQRADGKGGLIVYIQDDAVWAPEPDGQYRAISLETMVARALKDNR
ncbi:TFP11-domain-containing protein [Gloeophyllum trabeum ATCC 11539]|uniref:TFP11-domain-containing protein n=1 Tax=Gloeophyllum trabeum (strain ATCC 11539 / FP-39264 / Madison 617) TaxID=670483 RepID=S7RTV1_GLOTA|nr:TFP11-domain-containing protein [Gloeophyllum trabeum ATCC 11539]EPQ56579.1 TFP11-domain-containing protein [Gloeophyllum trabeum ATCC 11539]